MDLMCSGKQQCILRISRIVEAEINPCPVQVVSYLEAKFKCVPGTLLRVEIHYLLFQVTCTE